MFLDGTSRWFHPISNRTIFSISWRIGSVIPQKKSVWKPIYKVPQEIDNAWSYFSGYHKLNWFFRQTQFSPGMKLGHTNSNILWQRWKHLRQVCKHSHHEALRIHQKARTRGQVLDGVGTNRSRSWGALLLLKALRIGQELPSYEPWSWARGARDPQKLSIYKA